MQHHAFPTPSLTLSNPLKTQLFESRVLMEPQVQPKLAQWSGTSLMIQASAMLLPSLIPIMFLTVLFSCYHHNTIVRSRMMLEALTPPTLETKFSSFGTGAGSKPPCPSQPTSMLASYTVPLATGSSQASLTWKMIPPQLTSAALW